MTEKREMLTNEELDLVLEKVEAVGDVLDNTHAHIVLHVLMCIAADIGTSAKDKLTKREFIADCVECLDYWYEDLKKEGQDE